MKPFIFILTIVLLVCAICLTTSSSESTSSVSRTSSSSIRHLSYDQEEMLAKLTAQRMISINSSLNEVYITTQLWNAMKYDLKKDFCAGLAIKCGNEKGTHLYWVDIKDMYSGKKLAKYSQSYGFKVY